jgi:hypothetical protein
LTEEEFQNVLLCAGNNKRLSTPPDDASLDGLSQWSNTRVFAAAWELTATVPNTKLWASVLCQLLQRCQPGWFDPTPAMSRWYFQDEERFDSAPISAPDSNS